MRRLVVMMVAVVLASVGVARHAEAVPPETIGDQVVFYYDARPDFTTFINLRNTGVAEITVSVLFYGPSFSTPFSRAITLAGGALEIIDVGGLRGNGLPAQTGAAFATIVNTTGQPIAQGGLTGNSTVANLLTGSAFGAAGLARIARENDGGGLPERGAVIDGSDSSFSPIRAPGYLLAAYYDPASLAPVSSSGNQLIFLSFEDEYEPTYRATIGSTTWTVIATRSNGSGISETDFTANGVTVTDLASVAGPGVNGAAGSMIFLGGGTNPERQSDVIYFAESLGTFGTGYLLPPLSAE